MPTRNPPTRVVVEDDDALSREIIAAMDRDAGTIWKPGKPGTKWLAEEGIEPGELHELPPVPADLPPLPIEEPGFWGRTGEFVSNIGKGAAELGEGAAKLLLGQPLSVPFTPEAEAQLKHVSQESQPVREDMIQKAGVPKELAQHAVDYYSKGDPSWLSELGGEILSETAIPAAALTKVKGVWPLLKEGAKLLPWNLALQGTREAARLPDDPTTDDYKNMALRLGITTAATPVAGGAMARLLGKSADEIPVAATKALTKPAVQKAVPPVPPPQLERATGPMAGTIDNTPFVKARRLIERRGDYPRFEPAPDQPFLNVPPGMTREESILNRPPLIERPSQGMWATQMKGEPSLPKGALSLPKGAISKTAEPALDPTMVPRHLLSPDDSGELMLRAMKGKADLQIAGGERGFKNLLDSTGQGGTPEIVSGKSPTAPWFKEVTTGPKKLSAQRVERALDKIELDQGKDVGTDVQRVKEALLNDPEFGKTPFAPQAGDDLASLNEFTPVVPGGPVQKGSAAFPPQTIGATPAPLDLNQSPKAIPAKILKTKRQQNIEDFAALTKEEQTIVKSQAIGATMGDMRRANPSEPLEKTVARATKEVEAKFLAGDYVINRKNAPMPEAAQRAAMANVTPDTLGEGGALRLGPTPVPAQPSPHAFVNPDMESTFQAGKEAMSQPGMWAKAKETMEDFVHGWTRTFKDLPNTPQFAKANEYLNQLKHAGRFATEKAGRVMKGVTHELSPEDFDLFERLIILRDAHQDALKGLTLPGKWTPQGVQGELMRLEQMVMQRPAVQRALDQRMAVINEVKDQLVAAKILKLRPGQENEFYFTHLVRDYAEDVIRKAEAGTGMSVKKTTPWFAKERHGTEKLYNFNYLEAESAYLQKAYTDLEMARVIKGMKDEYDILPRLQAQAREWNLNHPKDPPKTWKDMPLPEGYSPYVVDPSANFYSAFSTSESIIDDNIAGLADALARKDKATVEALVTDSLENYPEELGEIVARLRPSVLFGGPKAPMIVPDELAKTLTKMGRKEQLAAFRKINGAIKEWLLIAPHKVWRYTFNNFVGDMEAVWVGNHKVLTDGGFKPSVKELWKIFRGQAPPTQDYLDALKLGVIDTGQITTELTDINNFADLMMIDPRRHASYGQMATDLIKKGWGSIRKWNQFRENMLRYAAYKHYKKALDTGTPFSYGASRKELVDALATNEEKAGKLARELLGDYASVSEYGQNVSNHFMMFYRWMEVNATRYNQLILNAQQEGELAVAGAKMLAGASAKTTVGLGLRVAKLMTWMSLIGLWNKYVVGEEDWEKLPKHGRSMPNAVIPRYRDEHNQPRYMRTEGSFADFLKTIGFDDIMDAADKVMHGEMTWGEALTQAGTAPVESVVERVVQGTYPHIGGAYEIATGQTLFPDTGNPREIRDPYRHMAEKLGLKHGYDLLVGDKDFNLEDAVLDIFSYKVDPLTDFYEMRGKVKSDLKTMKGENPDRDVLYEWTKALKRNDLDKIQKLTPFVQDLVERDPASYKRAMDALDPTAGLGKTDRAKYSRSEWEQNLSPEERRRLQRAMDEAKAVRRRDPFKDYTLPKRKKNKAAYRKYWGL